MGPPLAYLIVIAVWATTPLAIKLSSDYYAPFTAAVMRFALASLIACTLVALFHGGSGLKRRHWKAYAFASLGIFPNMPLVYSATGYISSGLISVMLATSPFVMGLLSIVILKKNPFTPLRVLGLSIALAGLLVIVEQQLTLGGDAWIGLLLMVASTLMFSLSNVLVKHVDTQGIDPLEQSLGAMVFALPGLLLCFALSKDELPPLALNTSTWAVIYLAGVASILGFMAFFYVLRTLPFELVGLVPLITPVMAMALGVWVAGETVSESLKLGSLLILSGLAVYELLPSILKKIRGPSVVVCTGAGCPQNQ
ncbi:drug/metabolite transporter (DMT)-like permease [Litorivivens lipolytica]|uniref:Drug/metabolite transporter (DMT)-like permease n=1 Tax=Litorivivens lipolytica TaxID=1524264 RepID=A0A7W4Z681_9GAMM|nr:DMT family transporter [Litorivivens lipolytica]MBB3046670.1 drug/metabolite transporter (DMT)-like permease [Litorivivens lipolytica]